MARTEQYPHKKVLGFDDALVARIENWRRAQPVIPTFSDAARALMHAGLDVEDRRRAAAKVLRDAEQITAGMSRGDDQPTS